MATPAQIHANRLNAMKSSGPRTDAGKAVSRFNALKHGIDAHALVIPGEDPAQLEALALEYQRRFQPADPMEAYLIDTLVGADWGRRRYARIEAQLIRVLVAQVAPGPGGAPLPAVGGIPKAQPPSDTPLGDVFHNDAVKGNALQKIFRRQAAAERSYFRALAELRRAQRERMEEEMDGDAPPADPVGAAAVAGNPSGDPIESTPFGFVPPNSMCRMGMTSGKPAQSHWCPVEMGVAGLGSGVRA
ncbi:MAG: hypothetical protein ABSC23_01700 [Bryobacteraceae bacterium]|jgi:hypothetical protein